MKGTGHYSLIQAFFWMAYCAGTGYGSAYLLSIGFENAEIGVLIAVSGILAAVLQPPLALRIDRSGKRILKSVILGGIMAAVILSLGILLNRSLSGMFSGVCFAGNLTVLQLLIPLINSLSVSGRHAARINYGFARAIGSVAYAVISYLLGIIVAEQGMEVLSALRIFAFLALAVTVAVFPVSCSKGAEIRGKKKREGFFHRYRGFGTVMAGCFFLYLCHSFLTYYNYQIVLSKGGSEETYGMIIALAAVLELPVMFGFSTLLKRASSAFWFGVSGAGYVLRGLGALLSGSVAAYGCIQIFQMLSWAMISVASVSFVKENIAEEDATGGQAFLTLSYTTAMAAGSLGGGLLLQLAGIRAMLVLAVLFAVVGAVILRSGIRLVRRGVSSI